MYGIWAYLSTFCKGLSPYLAAGIWIRIRIRVRVKIASGSTSIKIRIRIRLRVISRFRNRIRIRIKLMRIHNTSYQFTIIKRWTVQGPVPRLLGPQLLVGVQRGGQGSGRAGPAVRPVARPRPGVPRHSLHDWRPRPGYSGDTPPHNANPSFQVGNWKIMLDMVCNHHFRFLSLKEIISCYVSTVPIHLDWLEILLRNIRQYFNTKQTF